MNSPDLGMLFLLVGALFLSFQHRGRPALIPVLWVRSRLTWLPVPLGQAAARSGPTVPSVSPSQLFFEESTPTKREGNKSLGGNHLRRKTFQCTGWDQRKRLRTERVDTSLSLQGETSWVFSHQSGCSETCLPSGPSGLTSPACEAAADLQPAPSPHSCCLPSVVKSPACICQRLVFPQTPTSSFSTFSGHILLPEWQNLYFGSQQAAQSRDAFFYF